MSSASLLTMAGQVVGAIIPLIDKPTMVAKLPTITAKTKGDL